MAPSELVTRNTARILGNCSKSIWHLLTTTRVGSEGWIKADSKTPVSQCLGPGESESISVVRSGADITMSPLTPPPTQTTWQFRARWSPVKSHHNTRRPDPDRTKRNGFLWETLRPVGLSQASILPEGLRLNWKFHSQSKLINGPLPPSLAPDARLSHSKHVPETQQQTINCCQTCLS